MIHRPGLDHFVTQHQCKLIKAGQANSRKWQLKIITQPRLSSLPAQLNEAKSPFGRSTCSQLSPPHIYSLPQSVNKQLQSSSIWCNFGSTFLSNFAIFRPFPAAAVKISFESVIWLHVLTNWCATTLWNLQRSSIQGEKKISPPQQNQMSSWSKGE